MHTNKLLVRALVIGSLRCGGMSQFQYDVVTWLWAANFSALHVGLSTGLFTGLQHNKWAKENKQENFYSVSRALVSKKHAFTFVVINVAKASPAAMACRSHLLLPSRLTF